MALAIGMEHISVDQTLHGYRDGHRLIRGSIKLSSSDARIMLALSDASSSASRIPPLGYLTGYPLADSGKYVLARTWAAPEKSRPGCVWTHSILIDFADLARLGSAFELLDCFQRPSEEGGGEYVARLDVPVTRTPRPVPIDSIERAGQWVGALYGKPKSMIAIERKSSDDDALVLAIWMQQWPRLRRAFRFCSFAGEDRSTSADAFDLQLMDAGRSGRFKQKDDEVSNRIQPVDWLDALLEDLEAPAESELRPFLRDVGSDIASGRAAMVPLIHLERALRPDAGSSRLVNAVSKLENLGSKQGRMGRAAAARAVLSRPGIDDRRLMDFALQQALADRDLLGIEPTIVGQAILGWRPGEIAESLGEEGPIQNAIEAALEAATAEELVEVVKVSKSAAAVVLSSRPDILWNTMFWRAATVDTFDLIGNLNITQDHVDRIIWAIIEADRDDFAQLAMDCFGASSILVALSSMDLTVIRSRKDWVHVIASQTNELAKRMADGSLSHRPLLLILAEVLDPDAVPNIVGIDPWVVAIDGSQSSDDARAEDLLAAFLFNRARGRQSKSAGRLFCLSVQRLHSAMAFGRLSSEAWHIAKQRLPYGSIWRDWDQCEKLRHAVVDDFVARDLSPIEFGTVVADGHLWIDLIDLAADSWRGRRYLKKVRKALEVGREGWWLERAKLIDLGGE